MPTTATMPEPEGDAPRGGGGRALHPGARLGDYRLLTPIGAGGMANVWAAARSGDYGFERLFAVKVMRDEIAEDAGFRRMFLDEAKVAARIHHTNVVDVLDLGEDDGTVYQVMPLVEGDSLARLLQAMGREKRAPRSVAARIVIDALRGLHAAHETRAGRDGSGAPLGIVHRDVSPQNILVGIDGVAKIADFGVAKVMGRMMGAADTGAPKGKIAYMAPEQLVRGPLDRRTDVFAAGIVLWELLTGRRLEGAAERRLASEAIEDPTSIDRAVPPSLAAVAMRALEARPEDRFASADEMADALEERARGCGLALSTKEVASWASALATQTLTRRREQLAEAVGTLGAAATTTDVPSAGGGRRRALLAGTAAVVLGALVIVGSAGRRGAAPPPATAASGPSAAPAPAPSLAPAPSVSSAPAPPAPSTTATEQRTAPRASPPRPHKAPSRPRFENPYAP